MWRSDGMRRSWQEIAMDLLAENNRQRFRELAEELYHALGDLENKPSRLPNTNIIPETANFLPATNPLVAYERIVDVAVALMRSDYASLQMLFPERRELRLLAFRGFNPQAARFWEWVRADSKSTCGIALRDGHRVVAPDIAACDFMADSEDQKVYLDTGIHACQTTPLIARSGNIVGMISTHWRTPHQPSQEDLRAFDVLAAEAADLVERCKREVV